MARRSCHLLGEKEGWVVLKQRGVSLIELMIGIALLAILLFVGVDSYRTWIQNTQVRTVAEAILNGMQLARGEAVRRNVNVQMVLSGGTGWVVSVANTGELIQSRTDGEGGKNAMLSVIPSGATTITFNGLGRVVANADASPSIAQVEVSSSALADAETRKLQIRVGVGGDVRMCDPQLSPPDPRACS
ncbi:prepilin-type N-terminal cleavage/methylation domain-containing protein [Pelomicrobium methylotrophicum]|uniref:Type II secretion system protein H n=1 Tax=Pelomicrobium methylotrophicum TaxID=2602750 RepID=A0A5C7EL21_9PROT|nr:prepilin-type N-terminal cleavage/methylation domain-containing protein [Pelomicrobium methylotrophicum]